MTERVDLRCANCGQFRVVVDGKLQPCRHCTHREEMPRTFRTPLPHTPLPVAHPVGQNFERLKTPRPQTPAPQTHRVLDRLRSLDIWNAGREAAIEGAKRQQPNGFACPKCGRELCDGMMVLPITSDGPQVYAWCPSCRWKGRRFI